MKKYQGETRIYSKKEFLSELKQLETDEITLKSIVGVDELEFFDIQDAISFFKKYGK
jgi:hypothetical protein